MWNVLLVEDEVFVRRSLKRLIRWEDMGFTIAGEAGDGREALDMMRNHPPDLVIADIVMPGMDGIELLKRAREEGHEASFVMLTCMNEFEYARQALEFGATAYMLKLSMNGRMLADTLSKVKRELLRSLQIRSQDLLLPFQQLYRQAWQSFHAFEGGAASGLDRTVKGEGVPGPSGLPDLSDLSAMSVLSGLPGGKSHTVWIGAFLHGAKPFALEDFHKLELVVPGGRSVIHTFAHSGQTTVFVWNPAVVREPEEAAIPWAAACTEAVEAEQMPAAWLRVLRMLDRAWYEERPGLLREEAADTPAGKQAGKTSHKAADMSAGKQAGKPAHKAADVFADKQTDMTAHKAAGAPADEQAKRLADMPTAGNAAPLSWKTEREWLQSFEQHRLEEFRQRLQAGWQAIAQRRLPMAIVKDIALRIDRIVSRIAGCSAAPEEQLLACVSHRELGERLLANAERYAKRSGADSPPQTNHPEIDKALAYIHRNYDQDVTLKAVAALVAMDETYFSGLFKKKTGATLIHYIQRLRIDTAKRLLIQTELPVAAIGERVGFPNANYFIKIFKRWTSCTPSEYRVRSN